MVDLWVAVQAGERRADLAVPAGLLVADLAVEAGRLLGTTGALRSITGTPLDPTAPLGEQAADGDLLLLAPAALPPRPRRWDDPADAIAAEMSTRPGWSDRDTTRLRAALGVGGAAVVAGQAWLVLPTGLPALMALAVGLVTFALRGPRFLAAVLAPGLLVVVTVLPWGTAATATVTGTVLVLGAGLVPVLSLAGGAAVHDVRHVVVAFHVATGVVLVVAAAAPGGPLAAAVVAGSAAVLALRARRHRDRVEALTAAVAGLAPWGVLCAVARAEPSWRPAVTVVVATVGVAAVLARPSARLVRMMDVTENVLVLVLPTLVVAWTATTSDLWPGVLR